MLTYTRWSSEQEGKSWPALLQLFHLPDETYKLFIGATNLGGETASFKTTFTDQFPDDLQTHTSGKTSKYWCEVFPDPTDYNNCTTSPWWVTRWKQTIRFMAEREVINRDTDDGLISTILKYWQPYCEKYPESICASAWQIHGDLPAIDNATGEGVHSTGGPVSPGFRKASFNVLNLDVTSARQNKTFKQDEEWMKFILGPEMYKFSNASYFNEAEYTLEPGHWEERFWGKENHCKLVDIKKSQDPNSIFACRHCVGSEVRYNDEQTGEKPAACDLPSLAKTYSQPGDQQWQTMKDSDVTRLSNSLRKGEGGDGISCLGLKNVVYFKKNYGNNYAHTRI